MRTFVVGAILAITFQPAFSVAEVGDSPKVFMYVTDGSRDLQLMLNEEVGVMRRMLEDAGYTVDATLSRTINHAALATVTDIPGHSCNVRARK